MRIYLDTNTFQYLGKIENQDFYELVLADKEENYYCFSEAHIQDLIRDKTEQKFTDIAFMETIVQKNCWFNSKERMNVKYLTPKEYYDMYDWSDVSNIMTSDDEFSTTIRNMFGNLPLHYGQFIDSNQLPENFPEEMKAMLYDSDTMLDFMEAMLNMTENMSENQSSFKKLLQYLHQSMENKTLFEHINIKGYDGKQITDFEAFAESFKSLVYERSNQKDLYSQFIEMQYALDIYGIVKGRPKKQKFMSLLNDGRHTYYAGHAHILVTLDTDMIAKAKMMFKIWKIETTVWSPEQFREYLLKRSTQLDSVTELFAQFEQAANFPTFYENYTLDTASIQKRLPMMYINYFNSLAFVTTQRGTYYYFLQNFANISLYTLTIELERVVNKLIDHFGMDELGRGKFESTEITDTEWQGREWRVGDMGLLLRNDDNGIMLFFFKAAPVIKPDNVTEEKKVTIQ